MRFLLDTNSWIHYLKPSDIFLCSVVKAELLHGAERYANRDRRLTVLRETFGPYSSLPFDDSAAAIYGPLRHGLEQAGTVIGPYDLQTAAICLANDLTVVTNNVAEFSRVPGLRFEDWLEP